MNLKFYSVFVLLILVIWAAPLGAQVFTKPYSHFSQEEPVGEVLSDFARQQGYRALVSTAITGTVSGQFDEVNPQEFLDGFKTAFGVQWYILGNNLSFFHELEYKDTVIQPLGLSAEALYKKLSSSALVSPQLPLEISSAGFLTLEGPADYLAKVSSAAELMDARSETRKVMKVFKLKYAQADDMTVSSSDKNVVIPGVATILNNLLKGGAGGGATGSIVTQNVATVDGLRGKGLASRGQVAPPTVSGQGSNGEMASGGSSIMADPRVNAVLIYDLEDRMPYYEQVINDLDQEVYLVEIHAAIVDINTDLKSELGINYQGVQTNGNFSAGGEMSTVQGSLKLPEAGSISGQGAILSTVYTHGASYFMARVQALEEEGEARLLGRPSVLTVDNMEATLENTTTYYIEVKGQEEVDLFKVESGTILRVTPRIIENKNGTPTIRLTVAVTDDQNSGSSQAGSGDMSIPPIKQTKINTQALVELGQSLLIGGYYFERREERESGVPGLRSVPLLGHLFKAKNKNNVQMERMVLITPRVIRPGDNPPLPTHIDDEEFSRSPDQANYQPRPVKIRKGGCSRP